MRYGFYINQKGLANTKLDIKDAAILDYLVRFCAADDKKIKQMSITEDGVDYRYTWINILYLIEEMPLLRIKSKSAVSSRFDTLKNEGFIKTFKGPDGNLYVRIMPKTKDVDRDGGVLNGEQRRSRRRTEVFVETNSTSNTVRTVNNNSIAAPAAVGFDFNSYLQGMKENKQRHIQIIALFWDRTNRFYENLPQAQAAITRSLRAAKGLSGYEDDRINETIDYIESQEFLEDKWSLETVGKYIDKPKVAVKDWRVIEK